MKMAIAADRHKEAINQTIIWVFCCCQISCVINHNQDGVTVGVINKPYIFLLIEVKPVITSFVTNLGRILDLSLFLM